MKGRIVDLGRPLGLNNRLSAQRLGRRDDAGNPATYLSRADNVDIDDAGVIRRRRGFEVALPGDAHSLWADEQGACVVLDGRLLALGADLSARVLREGMPRLRLSYSRSATGALVWSNSAALRRVVDGHDRALAEAPPLSPSVTAQGAGGLPAGRYLACMTVQGPDGESAPSAAQVVDLPQGGSVAFTAQVPAGRQLAAWLSGPNGDRLGLAGVSASGRFLADAPAETGHECPTMGLSPMPPGQLVAHFQGRLWVAAGNVLWYSQPWHEGLTDARGNYLLLPQRITLLRPAAGALFVAAGKTWRLDTAGGALQEALPYGAVEGTDTPHPETGGALWFSPRGLIVADAQGVRAVQQEALTFEPAALGAALWREADGVRAQVTSLSTGGASGAVPGSQAGAVALMYAEVIKKGNP